MTTARFPFFPSDTNELPRPEALVWFIFSEALNKERFERTEAKFESLREEIEQLKQRIPNAENRSSGIAPTVPRLIKSDPDNYAEQLFDHFRREFLTAIQEEPIEDGIAHPVEGIVREHLTTHPALCLEWLARLFGEYYSRRPSFCSALLRCIARLPYDAVRSWGLSLVRYALSHRSTEVREAAVRALDNWGGAEALTLLREHSEQPGWLADYVQQVIADLTADMGSKSTLEKE